MRLPPSPVLLAAKRWLELLPSSGGVPRARALLTSHESYDDLTPTQYASALTWLKDVGLLDTIASPVPEAFRVLGAVFERGAPAWMRDADSLVQTPDELPTDIVEAGRVLGLGTDDIYGQLLTSWGKVDTEVREQVGAAGEAALASALRSRTDAKVDQVSAWSDGFGYDIAVVGGDVSAHLEVKSTTRSGRLTVYMSRNEYNVMLRDEDWVMVAVRLTTDLTLDGSGSISKEWILENAPRDSGAAGHWASCKLEVPPEVIHDGIPRIRQALTAPLPGW